MIEYHRSERYRPDQGFTVAVAGLVNMKSPGAFKPHRLYKVRRDRWKLRPHSKRNRQANFHGHSSVEII